MGLYIEVFDVNTLAPLDAFVRVVFPGYDQERQYISPNLFEFPVPPGTDVTVTVRKDGYTSKTFSRKTDAQYIFGFQTIQVWLVPPPPPTPPPSGESIIGTVGTSCDLLTKSMFGQSWYSYRNRYTGEHWSWDSDQGDAAYAANRNSKCFVIPEVPPDPKAPGNVVDAISQKITASENTLSGKIEGIKNSIETRISDTLAGITNLTSITTDIRSRLDVLAPIKKFVDDFKFPDWNSAIVAPLDAKLQPLRDLKADVGDFFTFSWFDALIAKIEDAIDRRASALVGVDPAKPFWDGVSRKLDVWFSALVGVDPALPFFDALWLKIETKVDVWFSGKLGIDPALPFWDELEKKIASMFVRVVDTVLDQLIPEPPKVS